MTDLKFKPVEAEDMKLLAPYFGLRPNKTCDSVPLDSFIWRKYYHVQYAIHENKALLWLMREGRYAVFHRIFREGSPAA